MANGYERVDNFERHIKTVEGYISFPTSFLYDQIPDPNIQEIVECTKAIVAHNTESLITQREDITRLQTEIDTAKPILEEDEKNKTSVQKEKTESKPRKDISELLELVIYSCLDEDAIRLVSSIPREEFITLKLGIYKLILDTEKRIKQQVLISPIDFVADLQDNLNTYRLILDGLKEIAQTTTFEQEEIPAQEYSNIVIAPNSKKSTYLCEDIVEHQERTKEIRLIFEKLIDGYFLKTKDTKGIEGFQNLYEYKHPNGIRILYIADGNIITICSLFMKDKQKSTRITNEYEEAIRRYSEVEQYIQENFTNPDFHIEQAELVGEIFSLLDGIALSKKVGE